MTEAKAEIKKLLQVVAEKNASDLHLVPGHPPTLRIHGDLTPAEKDPLTVEHAKEIIFSLLNESQQKKFEEEKELDIPFEVKGLARFRVNIHYAQGGVCASLRFIPTTIPTLDELRLPKIVEEFSKEPRGLVLVTGPTGSGKTTTQACMLDIINHNFAKHILTIEDPIEYTHKPIKSIIEQREVGQDTLSFSEALKRVLRQDPDVILIGEMRDLETIRTAITAAETGHLVISTLHTNDSAQSIDRIIDVFPPHQQNQVRLQLSLVLMGIISQQLIPRRDNNGLALAVEILKANSGIRNLIRKSQTHEINSMIEIGGKYGMQSMDSSIKKLYNQKLIALEEALGHAINPEQLEKTIEL